MILFVYIQYTIVLHNIYSASQKKGNPISYEYIFIKEKAKIMILRSSFRVFNLLSFNTKHDMMHSRMTNQEQFERRHVRIDLHRIMDVCGYRQDWNNWHELRHNLTWWSIFCDSLFNHRPAYNNTYSPICPKKPLVSFSNPPFGQKQPKGVIC